MIDLHTHSTASDGTDSPTELVKKAHTAGIRTLALTDHDTTAGWDEAAAALPTGMRLVRGAEFSTHSADGRGGTVSTHLLGYLFDRGHPALAAERERLQRASRERSWEMVTRSAAEFPDKRIDVEVTVAALPAGVAVGRQHLATILLEHGAVATRQEAFDGPLRKGGPVYVPKASTPIETAIRMIVEAGGVAVFAHSLAHRRGSVVDTSVIRRLVDEGLGGIEVDHPDHDSDGRRTLRALARELGLLVTGSSDYHGTNKTTAIAAESTSEEMLGRLVGQARGVEVLTG